MTTVRLIPSSGVRAFVALPIGVAVPETEMDRDVSLTEDAWGSGLCECVEAMTTYAVAGSRARSKTPGKSLEIDMVLFYP